MPGWLWEISLVAGGFVTGGFLALLLRAMFHARMERQALRALIGELRVVRPAAVDHPADRRARQAVELWSELAAQSPSVDRRLWELLVRMVLDVAAAYGRELSDVRISQAAQIVSRLLSEDLGRTLSVLERYMTVHRVLQLQRYWRRYQEWSARYPALGPGLRLANSVRIWGLRAYRLISRRIPQLLFFEAAGSAATYGAREYFASLVSELTGRVGLAAIELYSGARVTLAEQRLVQAGLEILLLEQLARAGGEPGEHDRATIAAHAALRGLPGEKLGPVLAELSRAEALADPLQLALRIEPDAALEQSLARLADGSPERAALLATLRGPLAERVRPEADDVLEPDDPPDSPQALLQMLWQDVRAEPGLPLDPPAGETLQHLLDDAPLFVRASDQWRLRATREEALALYPKLRKALWLGGAGRSDAELPAEVAARVAGLVGAEPDELLPAYRRRFERARNSWLALVTPTRVDRERLARFVDDGELVRGLTAR